MSILVELAIEIGAVAAKAICTLWLKDGFANDLSADLIDFFKAKTSNRLAQRQGQRVFEKIGDKITEELKPILEEGAPLDEGERTAVMHFVIGSLQKTQLTSEIILQRNLQPIELKRYIMAANPLPERDFSQDGCALYERLITEVCTYIINISIDLPGFTEKTFVEVLQREDLIANRIEQVLQELRAIREDLSPFKKADRFEKEYREAVARNLDMLQLIGADSLLAQSPPPVERRLYLALSPPATSLSP